MSPSFLASFLPSRLKLLLRCLPAASLVAAAAAGSACLKASEPAMSLLVRTLSAAGRRWWWWRCLPSPRLRSTMLLSSGTWYSFQSGRAAADFSSERQRHQLSCADKQEEAGTNQQKIPNPRQRSPTTPTQKRCEEQSVNSKVGEGREGLRTCANRQASTACSAGPTTAWPRTPCALCKNRVSKVMPGRGEV